MWYIIYTFYYIEKYKKHKLKAFYCKYNQIKIVLKIISKLTKFWEKYVK